MDLKPKTKKFFFFNVLVFCDNFLKFFNQLFLSLFKLSKPINMININTKIFRKRFNESKVCLLEFFLFLYLN